MLLFFYFFFKINFFKNFLGNAIKVSNSLDPDQDQHSVGPDLCPNCLQRLSAGYKGHLYLERGLNTRIISPVFKALQVFKCNEKT